MKRFSSELVHSYETYSFGYANYAKREAGDALSAIYTAGFLPYSGSPECKDVFYMARSARISLPKFSENSENRRIGKRFDGMFRKERIPFSSFMQTDAFFSFCREYFAKRHGGVMPQERLRAILDSGLITDILLYTKDGVPAAYVLEVGDATIGHFWFSFYTLSLIHQSLGMWLMLDAARDAKVSGRTHYYLGTVYGEKALYKTNFDSFEYWNGEAWSPDVQTLKTRSRSDIERAIRGSDEWKNGLRKFKPDM